MTSDPSRFGLRAGDLERDAVCRELSSQYGLGRLTPDELEQRLELAVQAHTRPELARLVIDLPPQRSSPVSAHTGGRRPFPSVAVAWLLVMLLALVLAALMLLGLPSSWSYLVLPALVGGAATFLAGFGAAQMLHRRLNAPR